MLDWALHDLAGTNLGWLADRQTSRVGLGVNVGRVGQVTLPIRHPLASSVAPLSRVLRGYWFKRPIFAGVIGLPRYDQERETLEINAFDPSHRLRRQYINNRYDGAVLAYQAAIDQSQIMWRIIDHVQPSGSEGPRIPVIAGNLPVSVSRDRAYDPGKEAWEAIVELSEVNNGVDFQLEPVATTVLPAGTLCKLDTYYTRMGSDKTATAKFTAGMAWDNCTLTWEPSGDTVVNKSTKRGASEEGRVPSSYMSRQVDSVAQYGIYSAFEGMSDVSVLQTLKEHAQGQVAGAAFPIDFFDVVPAVEGKKYVREGAVFKPIRGMELGKPPSFGPGADFDYFIGDTISCAAKIPPAIDGTFSGRVTDAEISEQENGDCVVGLSVGPSLTASGVT